MEKSFFDFLRLTMINLIWMVDRTQENGRWCCKVCSMLDGLKSGGVSLKVFGVFQVDG